MACLEPTTVSFNFSASIFAMPRVADAEGFKFQSGEIVEIADDYQDGLVLLIKGTKAKILNRMKTEHLNDGDPVYQIKVPGEGHYFPVVEEAFVDK
ncbi:hypothetical protein NMY22_g14655 [Coprinellus aureogranulatus]|nr:hypothetical protein NMY22_g14655 [Coprinellus aureogranulatus]